MATRIRFESTLALIVALGLVAGGAPAAAGGETGGGRMRWPVVGPVIGVFDPPDSPYGAGHRGIDIAVPSGTPVAASERGVVAFAGRIGVGRYVSIDHPNGLRTTYSWLESISVRRGEQVAAGHVVGTSGAGHPQSSVPHLHFGVRRGDTYLDPLAWLEPLNVSDLIRLVA